MKYVRRALVFGLGAATAVVVMVVAGAWPSRDSSGVATSKEVEALRLKIEMLDRTLRDSEAKLQAESERLKRDVMARAAEEEAKKSLAEEVKKARAVAVLKAATATRITCKARPR